MSAHSIQKNYYELLAKLTLQKLFPAELNNLISSDKPDLLLPDKSIGIEITRAISRTDAEKSSFFSSKLCGKYMCDIETVKLQKFCEDGTTLFINTFGGTLENRMVGYMPPARWQNLDAINCAIEKKIQHINSIQYEETTYLDLYVFSDNFKEYEMHLVKEMSEFAQSTQASLDKKFRYLYFDDCGWFYRCELSTGNVEFYETDSFLHEICVEAKKERYQFQISRDDEMRVKLEDVCERGSSNLKQSDVIEKAGEYPIYGAAGYIGNVGFYHQEKPYVAVVKDGAGIGRTMLLPAKSSVIGTMQYLLPKDNVLPEYLCYVVQYMHLEKYFSGATIPHIYFRDYKSEEFNLDPIEKQREIVDILGKVQTVIDARQREIQKLDELIKARFVEMFGEPQKNQFDYRKASLKDTCKVITGNTPSRAIDEYYGDHIEWVKTDNIVSGITNPTVAVEKLSVKGMEVGRTVDEGSILMACIAGSIASIGRVCITDRRVAFNQQINAIVPNEYNTYFLYVMLQLSKGYLVEEINMALKGILSKSKLEEKTFIVPPMELQNQFADFVKQVDKSKGAVQKALDEAQLLFDSLMQKYFG